jgi:FkbM family methyltransferase
MVKKLLPALQNRLAGRMKMQRFYEQMFSLSIDGMNYGRGDNFYDSGELVLLNLLIQYFKESDRVVFDVGANVGDYSKTLSDTLPPHVTIHVFEPSKKTFQLLLENTKHVKNIVANNFGLSDKDGTTMLYQNDNLSGLSSVYHRNLKHIGIDMNNSEEIYVTTIDRYCINANISKIDFLKLYIEGHELNALKGAQQMLKAGNIEFIQFEFGGCNIDSRTYFRDFFYMLEDQYRLFRIVKDGLVDIPAYKETCEIFTTSNYFAAKKRTLLEKQL